MPLGGERPGRKTNREHPQKGKNPTTPSPLRQHTNKLKRPPARPKKEPAKKMKGLSREEKKGDTDEK